MSILSYHLSSSIVLLGKLRLSFSKFEMTEEKNTITEELSFRNEKIVSYKIIAMFLISALFGYVFDRYLIKFIYLFNLTKILH